MAIVMPTLGRCGTANLCASWIFKMKRSKISWTVSHRFWFLFPRMTALRHVPLFSPRFLEGRFEKRVEGVWIWFNETLDRSACSLEGKCFWRSRAGALLYFDTLFGGFEVDKYLLKLFCIPFDFDTIFLGCFLWCLARFGIGCVVCLSAVLYAKNFCNHFVKWMHIYVHALIAILNFEMNASFDYNWPTQWSWTVSTPQNVNRKWKKFHKASKASKSSQAVS